MVMKTRDPVTGKTRSQSNTCSELDRLVPAFLGVSKAILEKLCRPENVLIVYSGDTRPCMEQASRLNRLFAKDITGYRLLIHEATYRDVDIVSAKGKRHSTLSEALAVAKVLEADIVLLTHFSRRYQKNLLIGNESQSKGSGGFESRMKTCKLADVKQGVADYYKVFKIRAKPFLLVHDFLHFCLNSPKESLLDVNSLIAVQAL